MAGNIKGITIEIDGETVGLQKALKDVNSQSISLQSELKQVDNLLKFNPGNTELLAQKQKLLSEQVATTAEKLNRLKDAQSQVEAQFQKGDIGADQYRAFQREIIQTESKLNSFKQSLAKVDNGSPVQSLKKDFTQVSEAAENAQESVKDLGGELTNLAAGAAAGAGIGSVIEKALDTSSLNTKLNISMELDEGSQEVVKNAINNVTSYGVDAEAALEGVRRQWALNKDASDESNATVVKGAAAIVAAYGDVDFTELIQETNELSKTLEISNEEALGLTYSLLKAGFPPDQLDIISEYGTQLKMAGFNAQEIQAIMAAGVKTGTWNIDNLLDGLKEGRIKLAEFGQGVDKATASLLEGTSISSEQLQTWGQQVAAGGEGGTKAMQEVAKALMGVSDETTRNALGVKVFGTMWEDQGSNIAKTILGMNDNLMTAKANQNNLNGAIMDLNADPAIQMKQAVADLQLALTPLLVTIANIIGKIAEWVSNNPTLAATITAIVTTLGILMGIMMGLAPIFTAMTTAAAALGVGLLPIIGITALVVAGITALIAAGVALYQNWDVVKGYAVEIWTNIKEFFSRIWEEIKTIFNNSVDNIASFVKDKFDWVINAVTSIFEGFKNFFSGVWEFLKNLVLGAMLIILDVITGDWDKIFSHTEQIWENIKSAISNAIDGVKQVISSVLGLIKSIWESAWNGLLNAVSNVWINIKSTVTDIATEIIDTFKNINLIEIGKNIIQGLIDGIKSMIDKVKEIMKELADAIKNKIKDALGIHSPSRVMMELGAYTGEGFALGIQSTIGEISRQSQAMAKAVNPTATGNMELTTSSRVESVAQSGAQTIIVPVNLDGQVIAKVIAPYSDRIQGNNLRLAGRGVGL